MAIATKKNLGQNWLNDRQTLLEIARIAADGADLRLVLEIGPGPGGLTSALFKYFDKVIAVELDSVWAEKLPRQLPGKNLEIINQDFLDFELDSLPKGYVAAGNIPYYITSPIIHKLVTATNKPSRIVLLMQKEVAERAVADAGDHSVLSLTTQSYAKVSLGPVVNRSLFTPAPKVDSQVLILEPYDEPLVDEKTINLIKFGFLAPRKKLINTLSGRYNRGILEQSLNSLDLSLSVRPANLSIIDWQNLSSMLK